MIKLQTRFFGEMDIEEQDIYHFPHGMPGFEEVDRFVLIDSQSEESAFSFLQSVQEADLCFIVTDPFGFYREYELELPDNVIEELNITEQQDVRVLAVVSVKEQLDDTTFNLLAPIILNVKERLGKQIILHHSTYTIRHKLMREVSNS